MAGLLAFAVFVVVVGWVCETSVAVAPECLSEAECCGVVVGRVRLSGCGFVGGAGVRNFSFVS